MGETFTVGKSNPPSIFPFSILERIELGETLPDDTEFVFKRQPFSILERIELGETAGIPLVFLAHIAFSILERIELGETMMPGLSQKGDSPFQYPRTDRIG